MNVKAQKAADLLARVAGGIPEEPQSYSITVRMPGELRDRVFGWYELTGEGRPNLLSRNQLLVALIEAGIEAVEGVSRKGAR